MVPNNFQRIAYRDKFRSYFDQAFQDWFEELAKALHAPGDFQKIRIARGDGGLDGVVLSDLEVYQVYAPTRIDDLKDSATAKKIAADFAKAKGRMGGNLRRWSFVHNHPQGGLAQLGAAAAAKLTADNPEITIRVLDIDSLWDLLQTIHPDKLTELFGPPMTIDNVIEVTMEDLEPVVDAISRSKLLISPPQTDRVVSKLKLEHNEFSEDVENYIKAGRLREPLVQKYFGRVHVVTLGEQIAQNFRAHYADLRSRGELPDSIFTKLMVYAGYYGQGRAVRRAERGAAILAVIVYFFERCDIFENPPPSEP